MRILAEPYVPAEACTTGDVARALDLTDEGVRHLVRDAQLPCTRTPAGWRLFRKGDVLWLANRRAEARLRGVTRLRPKKQGLRGGPHQMSLFGEGLRLVPSRPPDGQRPEKGQVDHAGSLREIDGSDNGSMDNSEAQPCRTSAS